jgi:hypothetical protein
VFGGVLDMGDGRQSSRNDGSTGVNCGAADGEAGTK